MLLISWVMLVSGWITFILFFVINIKTVRRLKKNPVTKGELGFHFFWGWYAITVSQALTFSKEWTTKRKKRSHGYMFANYNLMYQYTTPFEKILSKIFILLGLLSATSIFTFGVLHLIGFT